MKLGVAVLFPVMMIALIQAAPLKLSKSSHSVTQISLKLSEVFLVVSPQSHVQPQNVHRIIGPCVFDS